MMCLTCLLKKCNLSAVLVVARTLHPSTGQSCILAALKKDIGYACGSPAGGEGGLLLISPSRAYVKSMICFPVDRQRTLT